ncbi:MAG TPA: hypothetical protein DEQ30_08160, partial [Porphyromonadaceae bacterium]|nr:hypothetical protein [Porphyromonadaceae bacterium]
DFTIQIFSALFSLFFSFFFQATNLQPVIKHVFLKYFFWKFSPLYINVEKYFDKKTAIYGFHRLYNRNLYP